MADISPIAPNTRADKTQHYLQQLSDAVPAEITGAYLVIYGLLSPATGDIFDIRDGFLMISIVVLMLIGYFLIDRLRREERRNIKLFKLVTFPVWVLGFNPDYWALTLSPAEPIPSAIFSVIVVLWATAAGLILRGESEVAP